MPHKRKSKLRNHVYSTYYETSLPNLDTKMHIRRFTTLKGAREHARLESIQSKGYVTVERNGFEIAAYYNGLPS
jgi:hypothetical protein